MNKTVSINLGGFYFHIDEDAYQKLNRYFDAIRRSLAPDTRDEIMSDIESRIAELLSEKLKSDKQVVGSTEVDEIIAVMGQPEDYRIDEETTGEKTTYSAPEYNYAYSTKKFYRDGEKAMISGVCAGLAHYFRIDPLWIRILFVLSLFISFGTSVFIYLLLWILIPKAITTTEKLEMKGEPINISNIEKKVKQEIDMLSEKMQNVDFDKLGANAKSGAEKLGSGIGTVFSAIFKGIAKVIGAIITITAAIILGATVVFYLSLLFTSSLSNSFIHPWVNTFNYTEIPVWLMGTAFFFAVAIPLFMLFLLGLKILVDNLKPVGSITKYTLLGIWIISLVSLIYIGISQAKEINDEGKTVSKQNISINKDELLYIKFRYNDYFAKSVYNNHKFRIMQDEKGNDVIYSNNISFYLLNTDSAEPYIQIEKLANGNNTGEARKRAEKIKYGFNFENNVLTLDNYLLTDANNKFRNQKIEVYLYLPEGIQFKCDDSVQKYDDTSDDIFNLWWDNDDYIYMMGADKVHCLTCPEQEPMNEMDAPLPPPLPDFEEKEILEEAERQARVEAEINIKAHLRNDSINITAHKKRIR